LGQRFDGLRVLDLFSGTGALGLEAASRGAAKVVLVDSGREALELCRANVEALGFGSFVEVQAKPALKAVADLGRSKCQFDLVFVDPPYALRAGREVAEALLEASALAHEARVVIEHEVQEALPEVLGALHLIDERTFGMTVVTTFKLISPPA
jgi:16S rRNA (guanine966-N2)-methyltransferase